MGEDNHTVKRTFCSLCPQQCGILVTVQDGRPTSVKADPNSPIGPMCVKGQRAVDVHEHPDRLNFPLKRVGARGAMQWQQIGWEQALDEIAEKLGSLRDRLGPECLATLGGTHKSPGDWSSWRFCNLFGTPNFVNQGRNCGVGAFLTETAVYGYDCIYAGAVPGKTRMNLIWSANPSESCPGFFRSVMEGKKQGMKVVVVDPRKTRVAQEADIWVPVRPRTSGALALGLANVIIREGLYDHDFVNQYCDGFNEIKAVVDQYSPERAAHISGVSVDMVEEVARLYATLKPARFGHGVGLIHDGQGACRTMMLAEAILRSITGNLDVEGGEPLAQKFDESQLAWLDNIHWDDLVNHPLRKHDTLGADEFPIIGTKAYQLFREAQGRLHPKGHNGAEYMLFANQNAIYRAVLKEKPYPVKAIIVQSGEPLLSMGGAREAFEAFRSPNLDLLVTMDFFMTPTAQLSDYVLPAADHLERPDISVHWGLTHFFACGEQAVTPLHERRNDYELWKGLGQRLGQQEYWPDTLDGMLDRFLAPSGKSFSEWTRSEPNFHAPILRYKKHEEEGFATFSGKVELAPTMFSKVGINPLPNYEGPPYSTPEVDDPARYPYQMIGGNRNRYFMGSNLHQVQSLRSKFPDPLVWIHPETAAKHGIRPDEWVIIERPEGKIRQKALLTDRIRPDTISPEGYWWYPERKPGAPDFSGLWESNVNGITSTDIGLCSFAGDQPLRGGRCRIAPADQPGLTKADLLAGLQATYNDLDRMLRYLDEDNMNHFNKDGAKTVKDTLSHLIEIDAQCRSYIIDTRAEAGIAVAGDHEKTHSDMPTDMGSAQHSAEKALDKLWETRRLTLDLVGKLTPEDLSLGITHPELGETRVDALLWHIAHNEANHTERIRLMLTENAMH